MKQAFGGLGSLLQSPYVVLGLATIVINGVLVWAGLDYTSPMALGLIVFVFVFDTLTTYFVFERLLYFFSQFVLPVQTDKDRGEIYKRVSGFDGNRGPTLFVKNGKVIKHEGEMDKKGPGVIVLDSASAVVLQTNTKIIGSAGPGIRFTEKGESITRNEGVDLRTQLQFIGPQVSEQMLFNTYHPADAKKLETLKEKTASHTRDGLEVSATLSIKFHIKPPAEGSGLPASESGFISQYGYNAAAVLNAVSREVIELGTTDEKRDRMEWNKLPAHLVVNLWREYVRKFKFEDLFKSEGVSGLQTIQEMINRRVRRAEVVNLDDAGLPTGESIPSLEYRQLEERGLEILEVRIHNVIFDAGIEENIIKNWKTEWSTNAKREETELNEREKLIETNARMQATKSFASISSQKFDNPLAPPQEIFATLQTLIDPIREQIIMDSRANSQMDAETKKLEDIWKWLLVQQIDSTMQRGEDKPS